MPPAGSSEIYQRCSAVPETSMSVAAARARYGTVLAFNLGNSSASSAYDYFTVPRRKCPLSLELKRALARLAGARRMVLRRDADHRGAGSRTAPR